MRGQTVSVIVVSRGRGESLGLTLIGLSRLTYAPYEIIVVADAEGLETVRKLRLDNRIKTVSFADPNISLARNFGISIAAGEIVAFIDDDAVPEPTWLTYLTAPFADVTVSAVGGFVVGRNGISFQWKARSVDYAAREYDLAVDEIRPTVLTPPAGTAIKTEGTNMALRRSELTRIGGFDPSYRFFLDDTDLDMRLAKAGGITAIAPLAQVHHAFAPSSRRDASRAPKDLFEVGASLSVYLRRHCPENERDEIVDQFRAGQKLAQIRHMVAGRLEPRDLKRLRLRLDEGIEAGKIRSLHGLPALPHSSEGFKPFETEAVKAGVVLTGRSFQRRSLRAKAAKITREGATVSLFLFSPTALFHRVRMTEAGVWEQTGGLWGKSRRSDWMLRATTFCQRVKREVSRIALVRGL